MSVIQWLITKMYSYFIRIGTFHFLFNSCVSNNVILFWKRSWLAKFPSKSARPSCSLASACSLACLCSSSISRRASATPSLEELVDELRRLAARADGRGVGIGGGVGDPSDLEAGVESVEATAVGDEGPATESAAGSTYRTRT